LLHLIFSLEAFLYVLLISHCVLVLTQSYLNLCGVCFVQIKERKSHDDLKDFSVISNLYHLSSFPSSLQNEMVFAFWPTKKMSKILFISFITITHRKLKMDSHFYAINVCYMIFLPCLLPCARIKRFLIWSRMSFSPLWKGKCDFPFSLLLLLLSTIVI
jgi:hypothetical protein